MSSKFVPTDLGVNLVKGLLEATRGGYDSRRTAVAQGKNESSAFGGRICGWCRIQPRRPLLLGVASGCLLVVGAVGVFIVRCTGPNQTGGRAGRAMVQGIDLRCCVDQRPACFGCMGVGAEAGKGAQALSASLWCRCLGLQSCLWLYQKSFLGLQEICLGWDCCSGLALAAVLFALT